VRLTLLATAASIHSLGLTLPILLSNYIPLIVITDVDGKGFLTGKDISKFCSYAIIPDLLNGKKTVNEIVFEFLKDFGGERNFKVSREKFVNYYLYLNFLIESDDAFEDHLFNQWSITSDEYKAYLFDLSKKESVLIEKLSGDALSPRIENDPLEPISVSEADKVGSKRAIKRRPN